VSKAILLAPLQPLLLQPPDNPDGMPGRIFDDIIQAIVADRPAYISAFLTNCYNVDLLGGSRVSDDAMHLRWTIAVGSSATGTVESVASWLTDFRPDLPRLDVRVLVVQGEQDRILPYRYTGKRLPEFIKQAQFVVIEDGPHAITWTHAEEVNLALLDFLGR
jgi:non-heme chloroperoxidase